MRAVRVVVHGKVQGVGFRYMTKVVADKLGVTGAVWNASDGTVHVEAQAPDDIMPAFLDALRDSPSPYGRVDQVDVTETSTNADRKIFRAI